MRIGLLGPVTAGPLLRGALARLALDAGRPVGVDALVDALWGDEPPDAVGNALQAMISRLRRALGAELVETVPGGYRLALDAQRVDALRFADLVARARQAEPAPARTLLTEAAGLWRGPALADVRRLPFAGPAAARLEEQRAVAVELAAAAALRSGEPEAELGALDALLAADPLRESAAVALARNLHAAGRRVDALAVLDRTRERLADELGVDPGDELAQTRLAVLRTTPPAPRPAATASALTSFVGRAADVARVGGLLGTARLVTLTGPGGAGKTRLAIEVGRQHGEVRVAELAPLGDADELAAAVLAAVRPAEIVTRAPDEADLVDRLLAALAGRNLLLVLDNCEHLVDAVARLAHTLLTRRPGLRVLATSREPLGVPGETLHPVDALLDDDAVRLFAERGAAVRPGFAVTDALRPAVREICRRLDGQPLAIELAAARLRALTPAEIRARLDDRFRLLTTGPRTAEPRHQTLRAVIDWSWDLLDEPERALARRLSVFAAGATEEGARAVNGPDPDTLDLLAALVDKSLLVARPGDPTRYRMLETIRAYAAERLDEADERTAAEAAHTALVLDLLETAEPRLRGPDQLRWVARLRAESDDLTAVLRRVVAARDAALAQRLVAAATWFWMIRGLFTEATDHLAAASALDGPAPPATRALCTAYRAMAAASAGDLTAALAHLVAAERLADGLPPDRHPVLRLMRPVAAGFGYGDSRPLDRLVAAPATDPWTRAFAAFSLAQVADNAGDHDRAREGTRVAHAMFAAVGDRWGLGMTLSTLGDLEHVAGAYDAAERAFDEAIALAAELGNDDDLPQFQAERARLWVRRGDVAAGRPSCGGSSPCRGCIRSCGGTCTGTWPTPPGAPGTSTTPAPSSPAPPPTRTPGSGWPSAAPCTPPRAARSPTRTATARPPPGCSPRRWRTPWTARTGPSPRPSPSGPPRTRSASGTPAPRRSCSVWPRPSGARSTSATPTSRPLSTPSGRPRVPGPPSTTPRGRARRGSRSCRATSGAGAPPRPAPPPWAPPRRRAGRSGRRPRAAGARHRGTPPPGPGRPV